MMPLHEGYTTSFTGSEQYALKTSNMNVISYMYWAGWSPCFKMLTPQRCSGEFLHVVSESYCTTFTPIMTFKKTVAVRGENPNDFVHSNNFVHFSAKIGLIS